MALSTLEAAPVHLFGSSPLSVTSVLLTHIMTDNKFTWIIAVLFTLYGFMNSRILHSYWQCSARHSHFFHFKIILGLVCLFVCLCCPRIRDRDEDIASGLMVNLLRCSEDIWPALGIDDYLFMVQVVWFIVGSVGSMCPKSWDSCCKKHILFLSKSNPGVYDGAMMTASHSADNRRMALDGWACWIDGRFREKLKAARWEKQTNGWKHTDRPFGILFSSSSNSVAVEWIMSHDDGPIWWTMISAFFQNGRFVAFYHRFVFRATRQHSNESISPDRSKHFYSVFFFVFHISWINFCHLVEKRIINQSVGHNAVHYSIHAWQCRGVERWKKVNAWTIRIGATSFPQYIVNNRLEYDNFICYK